MAKETPSLQEITRDIAIAYIQSLGAGSAVLFHKAGKEHTVTENFEETWARIVKTVSGQNPV